MLQVFNPLLIWAHIISNFKDPFILAFFLRGSSKKQFQLVTSSAVASNSAFYFKASSQAPRSPNGCLLSLPLSLFLSLPPRGSYLVSSLYGSQSLLSGCLSISYLSCFSLSFVVSLRHPLCSSLAALAIGILSSVCFFHSNSVSLPVSLSLSLSLSL